MNSCYNLLELTSLINFFQATTEINKSSLTKCSTRNSKNWMRNLIQIKHRNQNFSEFCIKLLIRLNLKLWLIVCDLTITFVISMNSLCWSVDRLVPKTETDWVMLTFVLGFYNVFFYLSLKMGRYHSISNCLRLFTLS